MIRRLLIVLLALSVVGYGTALAFDIHGGHGAGDTPLALHDDGGDSGGNLAGDVDHCCHGVVHLLGLGSPLPTLFHFDKPVPLAHPASGFCSHSPPSLLRPPILT